MLANNPNPPNQQLGKIVIDAEEYQSLSGQVFEVRRTEVTGLENNVLRKEIRSEVDPPLADRRVPDSVREIRDCHICLRSFHMENVYRCPKCKSDFCKDCEGSIDTKGNELIVCAKCAEEANTGLIRKIFKRFWKLGD